MTPTNKLRFVERFVNMNTDQKTGISTGHAIKILQQWWAPHRTFSDGYGYQTVELVGGEWRDIPLEAE
jgi:hypothetical protein